MFTIADIPPSNAGFVILALATSEYAGDQYVLAVTRDGSEYVTWHAGQGSSPGSVGFSGGHYYPDWIYGGQGDAYTAAACDLARRAGAGARVEFPVLSSR